MNYRIIIENKATKEADKIPLKYRTAIDDTILSFALNPRPRNAIKLTDRNGYRIRVGNYRILYAFVFKSLLLYNRELPRLIV